MFNTVLRKFKRFEVATSELWKTDSNPKLPELFNDRPERKAGKIESYMRMNTFQRLLRVFNCFRKRILGEIEKNLIRKCLRKEQCASPRG